ncbi:MAG: LysR family transcriptional regulator [Methanobacteriaceae archaeon]|nr:LysR family transcriptional regulator [Methanobacteriaceae archaeon]
MKYETKLNLTINDQLYDYKLFDTLKSIHKTQSQRKAAKKLKISHTVLNRRVLSAEKKIKNQLVITNNNGSYLTPLGIEILEKYIEYENRLKNKENIVICGGQISCDLMREFATAYGLNNITTIETDIESALNLVDEGQVDILCFDDPVYAFMNDIDIIPLARDHLVLLSKNKENITNIQDCNNLNFIEIDQSIQRLVWNTFELKNINYNLKKSVKSPYAAIKAVEKEENLYTFINKSVISENFNTYDIIPDETKHIIGIVNVKDDSKIEDFLNFASHKAQPLTTYYGFENIID